MGVYILRPHAAGMLYAPHFYTPPTPRRVFSGVGGWGCTKSGAVLLVAHSHKSGQNRFFALLQQVTLATCSEHALRALFLFDGLQNSSFIVP